MNSIITRGYGTKSLIITRGYGPYIDKINVPVIIDTKREYKVFSYIDLITGVIDSNFINVSDSYNDSSFMSSNISNHKMDIDSDLDYINNIKVSVHSDFIESRSVINKINLNISKLNKPLVSKISCVNVNIKNKYKATIEV
jgi:hypothetical protein